MYALVAGLTNDDNDDEVNYTLTPRKYYAQVGESSTFRSRNLSGTHRLR